MKLIDVVQLEPQASPAGFGATDRMGTEASAAAAKAQAAVQLFDPGAGASGVATSGADGSNGHPLVSDPTATFDPVRRFEPSSPSVPAMPSACQSGGCGGGDAPRPEPPSYGEVRVNGVLIEPDAIAEEAQLHPGADAEASWMAGARALAIRELLLQQAARLGVEAEPEEDEAGRRETDEEALIRALLEQELAPPTATLPECRRYYEANRARFRTPELFEASHILFELAADAGEGEWAQAERRARAVAAEVGDDGERFADAARRLSACPTAHQGGSLGQVRRGDLVAPVQRALEALAEGQCGREPVRSRFGWHLLRLQRRLPGRTLPFELVQGKIADMLEARAWSVAAARHVTGLAAEADIAGVVIDPGVH